MSDLRHTAQLFERGCLELGLKLNVGKTKAMFFGTRPSGNLMLQDTEISWVTEYKYLGFVVDKPLRHSRHVTYITGRVQSRLNVMRMLSGSTWGASAKCLRMYYKGAIRSLLEYAAPAYINKSNTKYT